MNILVQAVDGSLSLNPALPKEWSVPWPALCFLPFLTVHINLWHL